MPPVPAAEPYGTRLAFDPHELYYTPGVEPDQAANVGRLLVREKYFGETPASVQVRYADRRYELRLVVRAGFETPTPARERAWRRLGAAVSAECFRGSPVDVHLCDEKLATLTRVPFNPILPELPVRVTFRPSAGGGSLVAQYRNDSAKYLTLHLTLRNPTLAQTRTLPLNVGPNGVTEHGWAEGWFYRSGETITVRHAGYEPLELVVP